MMYLNKPTIAIDNTYKEAVCTTECLLHTYGEITSSHRMNDQVKHQTAIGRAFPPATFSFTNGNVLATRRVSPKCSFHACEGNMAQAMTE